MSLFSFILVHTNTSICIDTSCLAYSKVGFATNAWVCFAHREMSQAHCTCNSTGTVNIEYTRFCLSRTYCSAKHRLQCAPKGPVLGCFAKISTAHCYYIAAQQMFAFHFPHRVTQTLVATCASCDMLHVVPATCSRRPHHVGSI